MQGSRAPVNKKNKWFEKGSNCSRFVKHKKSGCSEWITTSKIIKLPLITVWEYSMQYQRIVIKNQIKP